MLNKKVIVTGGSYGIGAHLVAALVAESATVAAMARTVDRGEKIAAELSAKGPGKASFYSCDVSDRAQVKSAFAAAVADMDGLDALVHVTGAQVENGGSPEDESDAEWDRMMDVNARGTFITNQEAFPFMKEQGGPILNFGSGAGVVGMADGASYAASKAAALGWSRSAAMAWGKHGVTVNVVCPAVATPAYEEYRALMTPEQLRVHDVEMSRNIHVKGKLGDTDRDLIPVLLFLLSDGARFITGQILNVDGGMILAR